MKRIGIRVKTFVESWIPQLRTKTGRYILVIVEESATRKKHTLLYLEDRVPCDECILKLIADAYAIRPKHLRVVEKKLWTREVGCCRKPGRQGTWGVKRLTTFKSRRIFRDSLEAEQITS